MQTIICTLLCLLSSLCLHAQDKGIAAAIKDAKALIFSDRSLAKQKIDSLCRLGNLSNMDEHSLYNVCGIYHGVNGNTDSAAFYFNHVIEQSADGRAKGNALVNLANVTREQGDYDQAIELLKRAERLFASVDDKSGMAVAYGEMASAFRKLSMYDPAVEYLLRAIDMLEKLPENEKNPAALNVVKQKLANTYLVMNDYAFAHKIYLEILPSVKSGKDKLTYALCLMNHAEALSQLGQLEEASAAVDEAIGILRRNGNSDYLAFALSQKAIVAIAAKRNPREIRSYFLQALSNTRQHDTEYGQLLYTHYLSFLTNQGLAKEAVQLIDTIEQRQVFKSANFTILWNFHLDKARACRQLGRLEEGLEASFTASAYADSLNGFNLRTQARSLQEKYKSQVFEQEARMSNLQKQELEKTIRIRNLNLLVLGLFVAMLVVATLHYRLKNRFKEMRLVRMEEGMALALREKELLNEKAGFQQQLIRQQEEQLTANALELARKNAEIEEILGQIQDQNNLELKNALLNLKGADQERNNLMLRFSELYPAFFDRLKELYPELTQSDLEFCALAKLNLSFKDIANAMNINHRSAFTKKYRIAQKMKVTGEQDFLRIVHET